MILVEDTNITGGINWVDSGLNPIPEPNDRLFNRRLKVEEDSYVLLTGENDVTDIPNWLFYAQRNHKDFWWLQDRLSEVVTSVTWNALDDYDKLEVIDCGAYKAKGGTDQAAVDAANADKVGFLMSENGGNLSLEDAQAYLIYRYSINMPRFIEAVNSRTKSTKMFATFAIYLKKEDAEDMLETMADLLARFEGKGHVGSLIPASSSGVYDYWNDLNDYITGGFDAKFTGPSAYVLNTGTKEDFRAAINDTIFIGNY